MSCIPACLAGAGCKTRLESRICNLKVYPPIRFIICLFQATQWKVVLSLTGQVVNSTAFWTILDLHLWYVHANVSVSVSACTCVSACVYDNAACTRGVSMAMSVIVLHLWCACVCVCVCVRARSMDACAEAVFDMLYPSSCLTCACVCVCTHAYVYLYVRALACVSLSLLLLLVSLSLSLSLSLCVENLMHPIAVYVCDVTAGKTRWCATLRMWLLVSACCSSPRLGLSTPVSTTQKVLFSLVPVAVVLRALRPTMIKTSRRATMQCTV